MKRYLLSMLLSVIACDVTVAQAPSSRPPDGWVVLSVSDYRALRDKAFPPERPPSPPPVPAVLSRVEYDLSVDGQTAAGEVRLVADVLAEGWVSIPVPAGLRVREARLDGRAVAIVDADDKRLGGRVLLSRPGRNVVTLEVGIPIETKGGSEWLSLPAAAAPVHKATVTLRAADVAMNVAGGIVEKRIPLTAPVGTKFTLSGRAGEALVLNWGRRTVAQPTSRALRLRGHVLQLVGLGEDGAQVTAQVRVEVSDGIADRVSLRLPDGFLVGQVSGSLVADWETTGRNTLVVALLEPIDRATSLTITGEVRTPREGKLAVPLLRLAQAEREGGGVAVEVLGAGEITERSVKGLDPAEAAELGDLVAARQSPALVAFRYRSLPSDAARSLDVSVVRYTAQSVLLANVDEARYRALVTEDGKLLVEGRYTLTNSQRSFLAVRLPSDAVLWAAAVDERAIRPGRTTDGALLLPILKDRGERGSRSNVKVLYALRGTAWTSEGKMMMELPVLDLPVSRTALRLHHSPRYRLTLEPGAFREASSEAELGAVPAFRTTPLPGSARKTADPASSREVDELLGRYQRAQGTGTASRRLPVDVPFPSVGPSRFVASELAPEGARTQVRFTYKRQGN